MRTHLTGWPGIGLLWAALGGAAIAQDRTTPEATTGPTFTSDTSSLAIQGRERLKDPEQRKVLRANTRQSMEQEYASLDQVMTLDANTRSKLLDLLTDLRMESAERYANEPRMRTGPTYPSWDTMLAAVERERFGTNELQRILEGLQSAEQRLQQVAADSKQRPTQLAGLLTPPQLAVYEANEAQRLAQELEMQKRMRKRRRRHRNTTGAAARSCRGGPNTHAAGRTCAVGRDYQSQRK